MKKPRDEKTPIRYGITPAAFVEFGWLGLLAGVLLASGIFRLVTWLLH